MLSRESPHYARAFLALLFVVNLLNYIDRLAITGLIEPIRKDLGATDAQMGTVGLAFTLTYSVLPPVFGWLGDRLPRTLVIASSCAFWSVATAVTGLARSVGQLVGMRAAVGVGEASYMSNAPGLIADLYEPARRGSAMSLFFIASPVGAAVGVTLAGVLATSFGWRMACLLVALPGIVAALAVWRFPEPVRGRFEEGVEVVRTSLLETGRRLIRNRTYVLLTLAYTGQVFLQNAVEFWLPTVIQRDKAIPLLEANTAYGAAGLAAGIVGPLLASFLGAYFAPRVRGAYAWICAASVLLTLVPFIAIAAATDRRVLFGVVFGEFLLANIATGLVLASVVTAVAPGMRATGTAVMLTTVHLLGDAISQPLVGRVSTAMERGEIPTGLVEGLASLLRTTPDQHLTIALLSVCTPAALLAGILYVAAVPSRTAAG